MSAALKIVGERPTSPVTPPADDVERKRRDEMPWEEDEEAQRLVNENPDGLTLNEVGTYFGVCRERIRQIEAIALRKIRNESGVGDVWHRLALKRELAKKVRR